jgi:hypothetical protein
MSERPHATYDDSGEVFRRNRTLTGSLSSKVWSAANESTSHLKSARVQAHELTEYRRRLGGILLAVALVIGMVIFLLWQFTATVHIAVTGLAHPVATSAYEDSVQKYYEQHPFERFRFAVNQSRLTEFVQQTQPEVRMADVAGGGFMRSTITIAMRQPVAGWKIGSAQYYVDAQGVSFTQNYYPSPAVQIIDRSGVPLESGRAIASNRFLSYVGRTVALSASSKLTVEQVIIPAGTTRQLELHLQGVAYPVKLVIDRPVGEQVEDMARTISYLSSKHQSPQYVDVRVSGKAFYILAAN